MAADTTALAIVNLARFMATTADEGIADDDSDLLPLVCLLKAQKLEENGSESILAAVLAVCNVWEPHHVAATNTRIAKVNAKVNAKVFASLKWTLYVVTPTTFAHLGREPVRRLGGRGTGAVTPCAWPRRGASQDVCTPWSLPWSR